MSCVLPTSDVESVVAPFTRNVTYHSGAPPVSASNAYSRVVFGGDVQNVVGAQTRNGHTGNIQTAGRKRNHRRPVRIVFTKVVEFTFVGVKIVSFVFCPVRALL